MKVESKLDLEEGVIVPCARGHLENDWLEEPVALSGETYLRLNEVDLDDPQSIFAFTTRYGPLGGADADLWLRQLFESFCEVTPCCPRFEYEALTKLGLAHCLERACVYALPSPSS